jgi:hypothetical protein
MILLLVALLVAFVCRLIEMSTMEELENEEYVDAVVLKKDEYTANISSQYKRWYHTKFGLHTARNNVSTNLSSIELMKKMKCLCASCGEGFRDFPIS